MICVDSETLYPPMYCGLMLKQLMKSGVVAVSATWSYFSDVNHSKLRNMVKSPSCMIVVLVLSLVMVLSGSNRFGIALSST
jgi:hypothetical protein